MGKKPVAPGGDTGPNTIFKATYSGVPVYEMICRNVAVMRRRSDGYLNATQILKVAGFDKPQRTRVLEREVQKGEHEKVQGGYGKYQGTWIPIERGLALSKQYGVEDLLRPIIDYVPTSVSPPPAPKHIVAPPTKTKKDKDGKPIKDSGTPTKTGPMSAAALQAQAQLAAQRAAAAQQAGAAGPGPSSSSPAQEDRTRDGDESLSESPNEDDDSSETPSPVASGAELPVEGMDLDGAPGSSRKRTAQMMLEDDVDPYMNLQRARGHSAVHTPRSSPPPLPDLGLVGDGPGRYRDHILNYFITETTTIPQFLITPPTDFNPDMTIDDDGHTPLHWACAMGRVRVVKLLLSGGASIFAANNTEQTPLMRSVMFSNNYDMRKFAEIYELLHRSTLNIDKHNRTVFHHIANLALTKGKTHAARYYMETILSRLADYPQELADVINFQDEDGETALTLAARARSKRLVKALLDHGADPKVRNRDFKSAEEYILEDERFRSSPVQGEKSNGWGSSFKNDQPVQLFYSEAARMAGGDLLGDLVSNVQSLARSIESEYQSKERDILQAKATLTTTHTEITETTKLIESLTAQAAPFEERKREYESLQANLKSKVKEVLKQGWETWLAGEAIRESRWKGGERGEELSDLEATLAPAGDGEEERLRWEIDEKRRRREELVQSFVTAQAEAGTGEKISKYRQLISASSGGSIAPGDVDGVMAQLLEMLENENETLGQPAAPGAGLHMPVGVGIGVGVGVGVGVGAGIGNGHAGQWTAQA